MLNFNKNKKYKNKEKRKKITINLIALIMAVISFAPTTVFASDSFFLNFTYNPDSRTIMPNISFSDVGSGVKNHNEVDLGGHYLYKDKEIIFQTNVSANADGVSLPALNIPKDLDDSYAKLFNSRSDYSDDLEWTIPFSFPGRHVGTGMITSDEDYARDATSTDREQAAWVGDQLVTGFNQLLRLGHAAEYGSSNRNVEDLHELAIKIANAGVAVSSVSFVNESTLKFDFKLINDKEYKKASGSSGIDKSFFRRVEITGTEAKGYKDMIIPIAVNKGYDGGENARMTDAMRGQKYHADKYSGQDVYAISWQHMVLQAGHNAANGFLSQNAEELAKPSRVENVFVGMFGTLVSSLRGWLGLHPISDVVFNKGTHGATSIKGTMPVAMGEVADFVYFMVLIVAILLLLGAFVSLLIKSNLSVINPQMRLDLKDSIFNILVTFFILAAFQPIWRSLMILNEEFVNYFFAMSTGLQDMRVGIVAGTGIAGLILSIAFFVVEVWFNFYYIVRALTIMVLYMSAPLMIITIAYGGRFKMIFENWLKELLGALFTQSIHAAIMGAIFAGLDRGMGGSLLWQFVILISIIPLSNMFRKSILQLGGDSISQTAERGEKGFLTAAAIGGGMAIKAAGGASSMVSGLANKSGPPSKISNGAGSGVGGGGGGGTPKNKLGDEVADGSGASQTGNQMARAAGDTGKMTKLKEGVQSAAQKVERAKRSTGGQIASGALKVGAEAGGALLTAGAMIGDMATDGGSSQALLAGQHLVGGSGKGGGGGGVGGSGGEGDQWGLDASSELIQSVPKSELKKQEANGHVGENGEMFNANAGNGKQVMTSSVNAMGNAHGTSNHSVSNPTKEYKKGSTSFDYTPSSEHLKNNPNLEKNLDNFADLSKRKMSGETLSEADEKVYNDIRGSSGISEIRKNVDDDKNVSYSMTVDHSALGWDGAATDGEYYQVQAGQDEVKTLPNFGNNDDVRIQSFNNHASEYKQPDSGFLFPPHVSVN